MPLEPIPTLIDKQDGFEIVRDQIAAILVLEAANQMALAVIAEKDPLLWKLRVFTERSNPWEQFLNLPDEADRSPIVNVWYETGSFPKGKGDVVEEQTHKGTFNIDCYGLGVSEDDGNGGHIPGDEKSAFETQRAVRLVRNILMAGVNTYLQLRQKEGGIVGGKWIESIALFQPSIDGVTVQNVVGARISLTVDFKELSPQAQPEVLELLTVDIKRAEDGELLAEADFDYT